MFLEDPLNIGALVTGAVVLFILTLGYIMFRIKERNNLKITDKNNREALERLGVSIIYTTGYAIIFLILFWITVYTFHRGIAIIMAIIWFLGRIIHVREQFLSHEGGVLGNLATFFVIGILFITSLGGLLVMFLA